MSKTKQNVVQTHLCVLPSDVVQQLVERISVEGEESADVEAGRPRFLRLPHPRTGLPCLFLSYNSPLSPLSSASTSTAPPPILELQTIDPPSSRSWFLPSTQHVLQDGKLLLMTPIDPVLLLIPLFCRTADAKGAEDKGKFRAIEDVFEEIANETREAALKEGAIEAGVETTVDEGLVADIWALSALPCVQTAMRRVCEIKDITPEITVYRYSPPKALAYLRAKASRIASSPTLCSSSTVTRDLAKNGLMDDGKEGLLESGRLRAACDLISQYLPRDVYAELLESYDFAELDAHVKVIHDEEMAAVAAAAAATAGKGKQTKKGKASASAAAAEKKRKARGSKGVETLKKANINGMATISSFFQKPTA